MTDPAKPLGEEELLDKLANELDDAVPDYDLGRAFLVQEFKEILRKHLSSFLEAKAEEMAKVCDGLARDAERRADLIADTLGADDPGYEYETGWKRGCSECAAEVRGVTDGTKGRGA